MPQRSTSSFGSAFQRSRRPLLGAYPAPLGAYPAPLGASAALLGASTALLGLGLAGGCSSDQGSGPSASSATSTGGSSTSATGASSTGTGGVPPISGERILDPAVIDDGGMATHEINYCATRASGVNCRYTYFDSEQAPNLGFDSIAIGADHGCGVDAAGAATCWGAGLEPLAAGETCSFSDCGQGSPPAGVSFQKLTAEETYTCGLDASGSMYCWGFEGEALAGGFVDLDSSPNALCGLATAGEIVCSGGSVPGAAGTVFSQLGVGPGVICGVRAGGIDCTGLPGVSGEFARVAAGENFACALLVDGTPYCWGEGIRVAPPAGPLTSIVAADDFACGRHPDDSVECWGEGQEGGLDTASCGFDETQLTGSLGGSPFSASWQISAGVGSFSGSGFSWMVDLAEADMPFDNGRLMLVGSEELESEDIPRFALDDGQTVDLSSGMLWTPGGVGQPLYCTGPGSSATRQGDEVLLDLKAMSLLGACPGGTPVEGEIRFCLGDFLSGCTNAGLADGDFAGSVDAITLPEDARYTLYLGTGTAVNVSFTYGTLYWVDAGDGTLAGGIIFTDPASLFGGAVYCIGAGSDYVQDGPTTNDHLYTFRNMTKLGSCVGASGTDSLSGCIR